MTSNRLAELRSTHQGQIRQAGDEGYDEVRAGWNLTVEHHPEVVAVPENAEDVAASVRFAAAEGMPIAVHRTGHGSGAPAEGGLLINTRALRELSIDPNARTARIGAGLTWADVVPAAAEHELAPLCGSSDHVGVMGYLTGGGLPVLGRTFGFAVNHVRELDLVTADGTLRTLSPTADPELFWAVRGGKGNFGVVTAATIDLVPQARLHGGSLTFAGADAERVLRTYFAWVTEQPDEMSSSAILVRYPDFPQVPEAIRGKFSLNIRIAFTGSEEDGARLTEPLRALGPEEDTVGEMPYTRIAEIYQDPTHATPANVRTALLSEFDDEAIAAYLAAVGPGVKLPFGGVELRHLGGALSRPPMAPSAVGRVSAQFHLFMSNPAPADKAAPVRAEQQRVLDALKRWDTGALLPGFLFGQDADPAVVRRAYTEADYEQLTVLKAKHDPLNLFRHNHNIPPRQA